MGSPDIRPEYRVECVAQVDTAQLRVGLLKDIYGIPINPTEESSLGKCTGKYAVVREGVICIRNAGLNSVTVLPASWKVIEEATGMKQTDVTQAFIRFEQAKARRVTIEPQIHSLSFKTTKATFFLKSFSSLFDIANP